MGGCHVREKGKRLGDWKRTTYNVIEFLLRLISHIHFIILSWLHATVYCRKFVLISVCTHGVRFHGACLRVCPSRLRVCTVSLCLYTCVSLFCCMCMYLVKCCYFTVIYVIPSFCLLHYNGYYIFYFHSYSPLCIACNCI